MADSGRWSTDDSLRQALTAHREGRLDEAARLYRSVIAAVPNHFDALHLLGVLEAQRRNYEAALDLLTRAVTARPDIPISHCNRGNVLQALHRTDEAIACYRHALEIDPSYGEGWYNLGNTLLAARRADEAVTAYDRILALRPDHFESLNNRGNALHSLKRNDEALECYRRALALRPRNAEVLGNIGILLGEKGLPDESLAMLDEAIQLKPDYLEALNYRANTHARAGRYDLAASDLERILAVDEKYKYAFSSLVHARMHMCDWRRHEADWASLRSRLQDGEVAKPFDLLATAASGEEQLLNANRWVEAEYPKTAGPVWRGERYAHDRIRVAYMSGEFGEFATSHLIAELFEHHDRTHFEITAVSNRKSDGSPRRERIESAVEKWIDISGMTDSEAAETLRAAEIDILVDLNGYFGRMRPGILALRPAPAQVGYLGYPGTLGDHLCDYILTDIIVIPPEHRQFYAEKVIWLPESYQANDTRKTFAEPLPTRRDAGLPDSGFVFCCFNNNHKIAPTVFDIWMRLLKALPSSVLWLLEGNSAAVGNLRRESEKRGVAGTRLVFAPMIKIQYHLARLRLADLFLDTSPHNAHTTASDALWAGVPVVTFPTDTFPGRVAASLLTAVGLPELITSSLTDYEKLALSLAQDTVRLDALRNRLAANRKTQPLFNTARLARHIEQAFSTIWERIQRGEPATDFAVPKSTVS